MGQVDYTKIAKVVSEASHAKRKKVGAVIVKDDNIISFGYNGTPSGFDNNCENADGVTKDIVLHAESNAISKCAKSTQSCQGATMYVTLSPCIECAKLIIQSGIKYVMFLERYHDDRGIKLLLKSGIKVYGT